MKPSWRLDALTQQTQSAARELILAGLTEHWGNLDLTLNPDLDDLLTSYRGHTIVALVGEQIVGTGSLVLRKDRQAEIVRMSVASTMRRSGLGQALVHQLRAMALDLGCTDLVLETSSAWTGVVKFYVACGFSITHTEVSEFGEDTWFHMPLSLTS